MKLFIFYSTSVDTTIVCLLATQHSPWLLYDLIMIGVMCEIHSPRDAGKDKTQRQRGIPSPSEPHLFRLLPRDGAPQISNKNIPSISNWNCDQHNSKTPHTNKNGHTTHQITISKIKFKQLYQSRIRLTRKNYRVDLRLCNFSYTKQ